MEVNMNPAYCGSVAYAYVPYQEMDKVYGEEKALKQGTLFPELDLPLGVYGKKKSKGGTLCDGR